MKIIVKHKGSQVEVIDDAGDTSIRWKDMNGEIIRLVTEIIKSIDNE